MTPKKEHTLIKLTFAILFTSLLAWTLWPAPVAEADLPPRNTPIPAPAPKDKDKDDDAPIGAWLELQVTGTYAGEWSVVQWHCPSDGCSAGAWENVDGWQGTLDEAGRCRWWVAAKDFGSGPFRWVVTQGKGGPVLSTSESFYLPASANQVRQVEMSLTKN